MNATCGTSTAAQRRAIVLIGRGLGMDVDELRALTPAGSLRALSFEAAAALLDRLNAGRPKREEPARPAGRRSKDGVFKMVTPRQREVIRSYQGRIGWDDAELDAFLQRTFKLSLATLATRRDASRALTVLRKIVEHKAGRLAGAAT